MAKKKGNKFVSIDKMSPKARKAEHSKARRDWGGLSPVTRKPDNPRAYNRNKLKDNARKGNNEDA